VSFFQTQSVLPEIRFQTVGSPTPNRQRQNTVLLLHQPTQHRLYDVMDALLNLTIGSYRQVNVTRVLQLPMALLNSASLGSRSPLSIWLVLAGLSLAVITYVAVASVSQWKRLKHVPGPTGTGWSKWWLLRNTLGGNMHLALERANNKYGECNLVTCTAYLQLSQALRMR
jgi:hypothetical protein